MAYSTPTGSLFATQSPRIEEVINKSIGVFLAAQDKVWRDTIVTNQGVGPAGDFGRDWLIIKTYMGGATGVLEQGGPRGDFALYGDNSNTALGAKIHTQGLTQNFPSAQDGANPTSYRLAVPMRSMLSNLMLTLGELQAEVTPAFIGEVIQPKMEGFARHISQQLCTYWYLSQNSVYGLTTLGNVTDGSGLTLSDSNKCLTYNITYGNYAIDRFMVGLRYQFYDTSAGAPATMNASGHSVVVCTAIDELTGKIQFRLNSGAAFYGTVATLCSGGAFATGDSIIYANSQGDSSTPYGGTSPYFTGIAGINSWMKFGEDGAGTASAYLLGNERSGGSSDTRLGGDIDVTVHPEFKSFKYDLGGQPLTEHTLRKVLRRFHAAKGKYGFGIDCLIASDGVWLAYEAQRIQRQYYDRTGKVASLANEGGPGEFAFEFDGHTYKGYTSNYVEANTVYGIKTKNNWKRYVPPDPRGVKRFEKTESWNPFRFVGAALTGTGSNQIPIYSVQNNRTLITEGVQMPGFLRMQLVPDQACGLKLTNVAEDRVYMT